MTQARAAFVCVDNADHPGLRTWVRGLQSLICYWAGRPQDALRYARLGAQAASARIGSAAVWVAAQEARAWGMVGNEVATMAALGQARRMRDQIEPDDLDDAGGILAFGPARQLYYAAESLALIPEQKDAAASCAEQAITAYEQEPPSGRSFGDEAGARCALAVARVRSGDVEGARDALSVVLDLPVPQRIAGIVACAHRVRLAVPAAERSVRAQQLREELMDFGRQPAHEDA
jgi:hypothetical protein